MADPAEPTYAERVWRLRSRAMAEIKKKEAQDKNQLRQLAKERANYVQEAPDPIVVRGYEKPYVTEGSMSPLKRLAAERRRQEASPKRMVRYVTGRGATSSNLASRAPFVPPHQLARHEETTIGGIRTAKAGRVRYKAGSFTHKLGDTEFNPFKSLDAPGSYVAPVQFSAEQLQKIKERDEGPRRKDRFGFITGKGSGGIDFGLPTPPTRSPQQSPQQSRGSSLRDVYRPASILGSALTGGYGSAVLGGAEMFREQQKGAPLSKKEQAGWAVAGIGVGAATGNPMQMVASGGRLGYLGYQGLRERAQQRRQRQLAQIPGPLRR